MDPDPASPPSGTGGQFSARGLWNTLKGCCATIILSILAGTAFGLVAVLPGARQPLRMLGQTGMPLALVTLGMSLTRITTTEGAVVGQRDDYGARLGRAAALDMGPVARLIGLRGSWRPWSSCCSVPSAWAPTSS